MRKGPIRCVRVPLHESFDKDMERIKEEREKLIQEMSDKCMTASDFNATHKIVKDTDSL